MRFHQKLLLTLVLLAAPALAEDLYIRGSKIEAVTRGSQSTLEVELAPLLKALGYSSQETQGVVYVFASAAPGTPETDQVPNGALVVYRDKAIEAAPDDQGHMLVNLSSFCAATGLRERRSGNRAEVSKPLATASAAASVELITNPTFKTDLKGWTINGTCQVQDAGNNAAGKLYSARLEHNSTLFQEIATIPGKTYEVRVEYYGLNPERIILLKVDSQISEQLPGTHTLVTKSFMFRGSPTGKTRIELIGASKDKHFVNIHSVRVRQLDF